MLWLLSVLGVLVILLGIVEVFHTLLHPSGRGRFSRHEELSLPASLSYAVDLANQAGRSAKPTLRTAGALLHEALDSLALFLRTEFRHDGESTQDVFRSYASDHRYPYRENP